MSHFKTDEAGRISFDEFHSKIITLQNLCDECPDLSCTKTSMRPQAHKFTVGESVQSHGKGAKTVSATGSLIEQQREERFEDAHLIEYLHDNGATSCPADARNMPHILIDFSEPLIDFEISIMIDVTCSLCDGTLQCSLRTDIVIPHNTSS